MHSDFRPNSESNRQSPAGSGGSGHFFGRSDFHRFRPILSRFPMKNRLIRENNPGEKSTRTNTELIIIVIFPPPPTIPPVFKAPPSNPPPPPHFRGQVAFNAETPVEAGHLVIFAIGKLLAFAIGVSARFPGDTLAPRPAMEGFWLGRKALVCQPVTYKGFGAVCFVG